MSEWVHEEQLEELGRAAEPGAADVARLVDRVREARDRRRRGWLLLPVAVAVAAVVVLALRPDAPVDRPLASGDDWRSEAIAPGVQARYRGSGEVRRGEGELLVAWEEGRIDLDVAPRPDEPLVVQTPEARVRVVGTRFEVDRDLVGTAVAVEEGRVAVRCTGEDEVMLDAGASHTCFRSAAAGLTEARRLGQEGADGQAVLEVLDRAVRLASGDDPVRDELALLRVRVLAGSGRSEEALDAAEAHLDGAPAQRARDLRYLATDLALEVQGCDRAQPHLDALPDDDPVALVWRADCSADRETARALLEQAQALAPEGALAERIRERLERLR